MTFGIHPGAQEFRRVLFDHDLGLEIQAGGNAEFGLANAQKVAVSGGKPKLVLRACQATGVSWPYRRSAPVPATPYTHLAAHWPRRRFPLLLWRRGRTPTPVVRVRQVRVRSNVPGCSRPLQAARTHTALLHGL